MGGGGGGGRDQTLTLWEVGQKLDWKGTSCPLAPLLTFT